MAPRARKEIGRPSTAPDLLMAHPRDAGNTKSNRPPNPDTAPHPRARGEHRIPFPVPLLLSVSPPRTRGAQHVANITGASPAASPPHAQGTVYAVTAVRAVARLTPACAGNTGASHAYPLSSAPHPHARREPDRVMFHDPKGDASPPPRTRGTRAATDARLGLQRLTPARGEHDTRPTGRRTPSASSPRTRGTLHRMGTGPDRAGLTPAHAGNTVTLIHPHSLTRPHPRARGEHFTTCRAPGVTAASPPRARGAHFLQCIVCKRVI